MTSEKMMEEEYIFVTSYYNYKAKRIIYAKDYGKKYFRIKIKK